MGVGMLEEAELQVKVTLEPSTTVADPVTAGACGLTAILNEHCQETETRMVRACHAPRLPLQNHPSGHFGGRGRGRATPWSSEDMLGGLRQRTDIPAHARTAHNGLPQKGLEQDVC